MFDQKALKNSMQALKGAYAVVVGLSLTQAVLRFVDRCEGDFGLRSVLRIDEQFWLFVAFLMTCLGFFHGAVRHLDRYYDEKPELVRFPFLPLCDFAWLFIEGICLVILARSLSDPNAYIQWYLALLCVDVPWAMIAWVATRKIRGLEPKHLVRWTIANLVAIPVLLILVFCAWCTDSLNSLGLTMGPCVLVIVVLKTTIDYILSWAFYFPSETKEVRPLASR